MLGRKSYTREELDHARAAVDEELAAYRALVAAVDNATSDEKVTAAREAFEVHFFNNLVLALDRPFVHRVRMVTGKDGNPLNEVEAICESLMDNNGILRVGNVFKLVPEQSVVKLRIGDPIRLTAADFERLSSAFFAEIGSRLL